MAGHRSILATAVLGAALGCERAPPPLAAPAAPAEARADPLEPLHAFESARIAATDFTKVRPSHDAFGPDPYVLRALPDGAGFVGILRGRAEVVRLDGALHEVHRFPAPLSPSALAVSSGGEAFIAGELGGTVARIRTGDDGGAGEIDLGDVRGVRDLALGPEGVLHAVEEERGRLITVALGSGERRELVVGHGPIRLVRTPHHLAVLCLLDHEVQVLDVDLRGFPRAEGKVVVKNDGPIWSVDARETPDGLLVAMGGVEDRPLNRTPGFFGNVDSFVFVDRVARGRAERLQTIDVSELGVVLPKAIAFSPREAALAVTGAGGEKMALLRWPDEDPAKLPEISVQDLPPGTSSVVWSQGGLAMANPLLDAFVAAPKGGEVRVVPVADDASRSAASRLGEALIFTTLIAPWNPADGAHSRFTCETCHFEGYVDGRTHFTGRGSVHATTKPLLGLFGNRPHFSRAKDPDMATMANNEFRVAGAGSGHDPWFSLEVKDHPWLSELHLGQEIFPPLELRRAFMTFLMEFSHRPNPRAVGRARFSPKEAEGAAVFRDRCARCHAARTAADNPSSAVPFDRWEELVLGPLERAGGGVVWGSFEYRKTGVLPYVDELGARTPSLRRLFKKRPYFTNGSARELVDVLQAARVGDGDAFLHAGSGEGLRGLSTEEIEELLAFLALL